MFLDLSQYYYVDWAAMMFTFVWIYCMGKKQRIGFLYAVAASIMWLIFGYMTKSIASLIANTSFIVLNLWGYKQWESK